MKELAERICRLYETKEARAVLLVDAWLRERGETATLDELAAVVEQAERIMDRRDDR